MGDHDPTPRFRNPRIQTSEGRELAARRARAKSYPFGVTTQPVAQLAARGPDAGEVTSPFDLLEREPDPEVRSVVERSPRNAKDPAYFEDVAKLAVALSRERTGNRQRERDAEEVLRAPREATRSSRRHLIIAAIAAATSLAGALDHRVSHPTSDSAHAVRVRQLEQLRDQVQHEVDRLDTELRSLRLELGRRSELEPSVSAGASPALTATTQGTNP